MYKKISDQIVQELQKIIEEKNVIIDPEKKLDYSHDEFSLSDIAKEPEIVVKPESTEEVSEILCLANRERIPVTPRGGATGLCGGCVPIYEGIVLSLERMNRIVEVDKPNQMIVVESGVMLMDFYARVEEAGLFFPPHPGDETAMIGGVIATNAGGARAVKYGVVRNYIRGLEVVLPSGAVIHLGGKLMKSSTGYNLMNLLIGSEGTLGIITKAIIQLMPSPQTSRSLIIPYDELEQAIDTVPELISQKILPMAVEFIPKEVIQITEKFLRKQWPITLGSTYLLIILDATSEDQMDKLSEQVAEICMENQALDVFVADSPSKQQQVLEIRSKIYEAIKAQTLEILDIAVPRAEIARHVRRVQEVSEKYGIWLPTFGHAADGNVHTHIMKAKYEDGEIVPLPEEDWKAKFGKVREELYRDCKERGGVISGEHGIGIVKKPYLSYVLEDETIDLMKGIKKLFDPNNILNPGKIFDL
ncbi:MAG: FAD-binding oxidoreductase [Candidatus Aminicenantes bacterium]|nr:FAD-binding oxidoreductase [Candidatus Aminicenantes bacterium]MDH5384123.1 FAD-binding oxidoreductase [Candidatus Aminicenantes bacterium]MDH5743484.1 FAD-binding oxidoreductase [Candidatus Aminicenantes bacterium]